MSRNNRRRLRVVATIGLLALLAGPSYAQGTPEDQPSHTDQNSTGTSPAGAGSTGWTGGTGSSQQGNPNVQQLQTNGQGGQPYVPTPGPVEGQPWVATGLDLKGPATRFPANKTPE
jgi:hypothetical protein